MIAFVQATFAVSLGLFFSFSHMLLNLKSLHNTKLHVRLSYFTAKSKWTNIRAQNSSFSFACSFASAPELFYLVGLSLSFLFFLFMNASNVQLKTLQVLKI